MIKGNHLTKNQIRKNKLTLFKMLLLMRKRIRQMINRMQNLTIHQMIIIIYKVNHRLHLVMMRWITLIPLAKASNHYNHLKTFFK